MLLRNLLTISVEQHNLTNICIDPQDIWIRKIGVSISRCESQQECDFLAISKLSYFRIYTLNEGFS